METRAAIFSFAGRVIGTNLKVVTNTNTTFRPPRTSTRIVTPSLQTDATKTAWQLDLGSLPAMPQPIT